MARQGLQRAVFLDRDGVINRSLVRAGKPFAPARLDEFEIIPGVAEALQKIRSAGFLTIVATNQPDIATGKLSPDVMDAMHRRILTELAIDAVRVCPHLDNDECACRKPKPGLLLDAARELDIDLASSYMVGDRWRDIAAGQSAGCKNFFIDYGYDEKRPQMPFVTVQSLVEVANMLSSRP